METTSQSIAPSDMFDFNEYTITNHDWISIGGSNRCDFPINCVGDIEAILHWYDEEAAWFIESRKGIVEVNDAPIKGRKKLERNDRIGIGDKRIQFTGPKVNDKLILLPPEAPEGLSVTVKNVSVKTNGKWILNNVSFQVKPREFVALLGPSGCGKSTLIQRIAGLAGYEGEIKFNGKELKDDIGKLQALIAYLPQAVEDTLHAEMTVHEAMEDFAHCHLADDKKKTEDKKDTVEDKIGETLKKVKLQSESNTRIGRLSGGEKRRLALALALLRNPQMLLLDEPTAGLDPAAETVIMDLLRDFANAGRTVIFSTHVLSNLKMCDKVLLLASRAKTKNSDGKDLAGYVTFFGPHDEALKLKGLANGEGWLSIYQKLENRELPFQNGTIEDKAEKELPGASPCASRWCAFRAIFKRLFRQNFFPNLDGKKAKEKIGCLLFSPWGIPLLIAGVLLAACWQMFADRNSLGTVCFCMVVAMFWLGLSGSVRNLVVERVPMRCLDKMRGMPLLRYFVAHVAFAAVAITIQALLFTGLVFLFRHHPELLPPSAFWMFLLVLALVGFSGSCVGLWVSACSKTEIQAVRWLPLVAIFALFLSKPVLETQGQELKQPLRAIEYMMPTRNPQTVLETELLQKRVDNADPKAHSQNVLYFSLLAIAYPLLFLVWAGLLQKRKEVQWDGR